MIEHTYTPKSGGQYLVVEGKLRSLMGERKKLLAEDGSSNDSDPRDGYVRRGEEIAGPTFYSPNAKKKLTVNGEKVHFTSESRLNGHPSVYQAHYDIERATISSSLGFKGDSESTGTSTTVVDATVLSKERQTLLDEAIEGYSDVTFGDNTLRAGHLADIDSRPGHYLRQGGEVRASFGHNLFSYHEISGSRTVELEVKGQRGEFTPESSSIKKTTHLHGTTTVVETSPKGTRSTYHVEDPAEFFLHF